MASGLKPVLEIEMLLPEIEMLLSETEMLLLETEMLLSEIVEEACRADAFGHQSGAAQKKKKILGP